MGQKRPREMSSAISRRAEVYEDLANVDQKIRLRAAHVLLKEIVPQSNFDQLQEILRRLIRGLCSGRKAARLGFSVALTEFLSTLVGSETSNTPRFQDVSGVIEILINQTQISGRQGGQEDRDHQIGRLFGAEAIIKSGILSHASNDDSVYGKILDIVFDLAKKKPWLREQCGFVLYQSLESPVSLDYVQKVIGKLQLAGLAKTPEGVAIWIIVQRSFPSVSLPSGVWHECSPLHQKENSKLALVLKEASVSDLDDAGTGTKPSERGSWNANVHFAWLVVITELLVRSETEDKMKNAKCIDFGGFWDECVENGLFKTTSSDERKYWGLTLFQRCLNTASTKDIISTLFSWRVIHCLANHLASPERYLHRTAERTRKMIVEKAQKSPEMRVAILGSLLMNGSIDFDKVSKTRTIEDLLVGLNESSTTQVCKIHHAVILRPGVDDEKSAAQRRQIAADQLVVAVKGMRSASSNIQSDESSDGAVQKILTLLARFAYFNATPTTNPPFLPASHEFFKSRLSSSLTYLAGSNQDVFAFVYSLVLLISQKKGLPDDANLLLDVEDNIQETLDRSSDTIESIHVRINSGRQASKAFLKSALLLMSLTFLQVYNNDLEAIGMLEELNEAFSKKQLKNLEKQGYQSSTALIEILLGLVAKPSKLFRKIVQQVFESIAPDVGEQGLQSLLKVLETKESWEGQEALFDQETGDQEDQGSEDGDGSEVNSNTSDEESTDVNVSEQGDQKSTATDEIASSSASSSAEEGQGEEGPDDELAAFNSKLAQALGTRPGNEDLNAEDSDNSDADMNDEEMTALDKHLENVFREQKIVASKKIERKDAKKNIVDFKCRVLELLEIFVKRQHRNQLALLLISPLLILLRTTSSPQVSQKAADLLREYTRLCKGKELPVIESVQTIFEYLQSVHREALMQGSNAHATGCSQASLLLARTLAGHGTENLSLVIDLYGSTFSASQKKALDKKNFKVKISLFTDFNNWMSSVKR